MQLTDKLHAFMYIKAEELGKVKLLVLTVQVFKRKNTKTKPNQNPMTQIPKQ